MLFIALVQVLVDCTVIILQQSCHCTVFMFLLHYFYVQDCFKMVRMLLSKKNCPNCAGQRANVYAGLARVCDPHKMCGVGRANPHCAGLMRVGPKRAGPTHIATPTQNRLCCTKGYVCLEN